MSVKPRSVFLDTSVIDFLAKNPKEKSIFIKRLELDNYSTIYISEIVMHELIQGPSDAEACERLEVLKIIYSGFKGKLLLTKSLDKTLSIEISKNGRMNKVPSFPHLGVLSFLSNIQKDIQEGFDRKNYVYRMKDDHSKINQINAKKFRARVISEKLDHTLEFKEFTGLKPTKAHKTLADKTRLSSSQFNKMARSDKFPFHRSLINLSEFQIIRAAVPKHIIGDRELANLQKNDSIDSLILTQAALADAIITKDNGLFIIGQEALRRGLIKCRTILLSDFISISQNQ